jgi:ribosomal protein L18E
MSKSNIKWNLEIDAIVVGKEAKLIDQLQRLSTSELASVWRAVVAELKSRTPKTKAMIF